MNLTPVSWKVTNDVVAYAFTYDIEPQKKQLKALRGVEWITWVGAEGSELLIDVHREMLPKKYANDHDALAKYFSKLMSY